MSSVEYVFVNEQQAHILIILEVADFHLTN